MVEFLNPVTGKKPVIGLAGFFGYGNYGDELFVSVYKEFFSDKFDLVFLSDLLEKPYFSKPIEEVVKGVDAIVIGGGDIVQPWNMDVRYFSKAFLEKPVFVVGVGVPIRASNNQSSQVEKEWVVKKYQEFFSHPSVKFIHARDKQSAQWIESKLSPSIPVTEAPDIVCALTLPKAKQFDGQTLGVVTRKRPGHEDDYSILKQSITEFLNKGWNVKHIVLGTGKVGERDIEDAQNLDVKKEVVYTESLDELTSSIGGCDALMSMKFHGSVVATMYGVPSIVMIPTNKNRNFMARIDRAELLAKFDSEKLLGLANNPPRPISPHSVEYLRDKARDLMLQLEKSISKNIKS